MGEFGNLDQLKDKFETKKVSSWKEILEETMKQTKRLIDLMELESEKVEASLEKHLGEPMKDNVRKYKEVIKVVEILKNDLTRLEAALKTLEELEVKN